MFQMDNWFKPTLDLFDPFDNLDRMMSRNLQWLTRPSFIEPLPLVPKIPEKYRVTVDCQGHDPKAIRTEFRDGKLIVSGRDEVKHSHDDYSIKEFKKTYKLPDNAEIDKLASFYANGQLVVEVPLKQLQAKQEDMLPQIVENKDGSKQVALSCSIPHGIDPSKVSVTCKDRDLIIQAEDKVEKADGVSKTYYYKRCTLPENTDLNALRCHLENNKLAVSAPVAPQLSQYRQIPIEYRK